MHRQAYGFISVHKFTDRLYDFLTVEMVGNIENARVLDDPRSCARKTDTQPEPELDECEDDFRR